MKGKCSPKMAQEAKEWNASKKDRKNESKGMKKFEAKKAKK